MTRPPEPTEFPVQGERQEIRGKASHALTETDGAIAQLGERFNGIEEVVGSIPSGSTKFTNKSNQLERFGLT